MTEQLQPSVHKAIQAGIMNIHYNDFCQRLGIDPKTVPSPAMLATGKGKKTNVITKGAIRLKWWKGKTTGHLYRWTPEAVWFNGRTRYVGLFYHYYKTRKRWLLRKIIAMRKKKDVRAKLLKLYDRYEGTNYTKDSPTLGGENELEAKS